MSRPLEEKLRPRSGVVLSGVLRRLRMLRSSSSSTGRLHGSAAPAAAPLVGPAANGGTEMNCRGGGQIDTHQRDMKWG